MGHAIIDTHFDILIYYPGRYFYSYRYFSINISKDPPFTKQHSGSQKGSFQRICENFLARNVHHWYHWPGIHLQRQTYF